MCGIVGIIGVEPAAPRLVEALRRLEYRGYDSAGVATLERGTIKRRRAEGKLDNLYQKLAFEPLGGMTGIGHTRWATHGAPTEGNAHPHATERVAVVHNGIIENFRELLTDLAGDGYLPQTATDTESVALWVTRELDRGADPESAVAGTLKQLRGAFALAFMFNGHEKLLIAARRGAPLAVGYGTTETYLGSDAMALAPFTSRLSYLMDGDWAVLRPEGVTIRDGSDVIVQRDGQPKVRLVPLPEAEQIEKAARAAKRAAAIGFAREKYQHLPPEAFDVPPSMTDEEYEERIRRKFGAPPA